MLSCVTTPLMTVGSHRSRPLDPSTISLGLDHLLGPRHLQPLLFPSYPHGASFACPWYLLVPSPTYLHTDVYIHAQPVIYNSTSVASSIAALGRERRALHVQCYSTRTFYSAFHPPSKLDGELPHSFPIYLLLSMHGILTSIFDPQPPERGAI